MGEEKLTLGDAIRYAALEVAIKIAEVAVTTKEDRAVARRQEAEFDKHPERFQ